MNIYDVIIVGYGPVSEALAIMLGRQGRSVAIIERWEERYPLPRAVCIDHETFRVFSSIGLRNQLQTVSHPAPPYRWFNSEWKELLSIDWSAESISGGPEVHFVHQPTLEAMLDEVVRDQDTVEVNLGWEAEQIGQTDDFAFVVARHTGSGESRTWRARYLIGADGANSLTRAAVGGAQQDRGFQADWLVVDILPNKGEVLDIPPAAQYCDPARPTTIVPAGIRDDRYFRRWEFMRLPHENVADLENEAAAWHLLEPWVSQDQATMVRYKVYTFRSLIASQWRNRRLLLVGDAAHLMPPFMGQGLCAGLRDAWNLAWKLDLLLSGEADDRLLDSYEPERRPHVSDVIDLSIYLGKVICMPDKEEAARRDAAFFDKSAPPPPPFPSLTDGILRRKPDGQLQSLAGKLSPHGFVKRMGRTARLDDVVGPGWVLVSNIAEPLAEIGEWLKRFAVAMGVYVVSLDPTASRPGTVADVDGKYEALLRENGLVAVLVRPDFYIYGTASSVMGIEQLIFDWKADLIRNGVFASDEPRVDGLRIAG